MDPIDNCQRAVDGARAVIATVRPEEMAKSTPCSEWDVRGLINHMIGTCQSFAGGLRGQALGQGPADADPAGDDPAGAYGRAADALMQEWRAPGALEKTLKMPFGDMAASMATSIVVGDQTIHTWDLAKALGRPHTMDEELAADTLQLMEQFGNNPDMRGPGKAFAMPVECPEAASIQERLIALSGRTP